MHTMQSQLLTADQVKNLLDVDRSTVYRMASDGRLPAVRIGRQWRFQSDQIEQLLGPRADSPVQSLLELIAPLLGVMMVMTDLQGLALTSVVNPCPWFTRHGEDPQVIDACAAEWAEWAAEADLTAHFRVGQLGFECARTFIRSGDRLVAMLLVGGLVPAGTAPDGYYELDAAARARVLDALPRLARLISEMVGPSLTRSKT